MPGSILPIVSIAETLKHGIICENLRNNSQFKCSSARSINHNSKSSIKQRGNISILDVMINIYVHCWMPQGHCLWLASPLQLVWMVTVGESPPVGGAFFWLILVSLCC